MLPRVLLVGALLALPFTAGCVDPAASEADPAPRALLDALADTRAMDWSEGNWWAYHATVQNVSFDVALIVHDAKPDSFLLGTNLSTGFFGLPWNGNVTLNLNPRIGPEEWPLFAFPLEDGKTWSYTMLGYDAKTVAHAAVLHVPGLGARAGYRLEATAYGQTFARYSYVPDVGWFTRLTLIEPTNGQTVLDAELTGFGHDWGEAYYVEETIRELRVDYPAVPGALPVQIPGGYLQVRATLTSETATGVLASELRDAQGRMLASTQVVAKGGDTEHVTTKMRTATRWSLDHKGAGTGIVHLIVTGLSATGPLAEPAAAPAEVDLGALLREAQSTRPAWPQAGQVISTGLPVGV